MTSIIENSGEVVCSLCRRQFSKYTCPTCNVPYCSLTCFRGESHGTCSESFYRKEVAVDIQSEPSKSAKERLAMMDLLKRFEQESLNAEEEEEMSDDEDHDPDGLVKRLADVDINSASEDDLWALLTPEERVKFSKALENPSSELAQTLLASNEIENDRQEPWWNTFPSTQPTRLISVPFNMVKSTVNGVTLGYNICALCIAYAYTIRYLSISSLSSLKIDNAEYFEAKRIVSELVPFLTARNSTTVYPNLSVAVTETWSRFQQGMMTAEFFALLLRDTVHFLRPRPVVALNELNLVPVGFDWSSHPFYTAILVLSDLSELFTAKHVVHKLVFYAAHILSTPNDFLEDWADQVEARALVYRAEGQQQKTLLNDKEHTIQSNVVSSSVGPLVREL